MEIEINYKEIGKRLRKAREKRNMTQRRVAEILDIEANSYGNFERGVEAPSLNRIIDLCVIFHITPGQLLDDCCPELILHDSISDENPVASRKALNQLLAHCSGELVETLYNIAQVLIKRGL